MPCNHESNVEKVVDHHGNALPKLQSTVPEERKAEACCNDEEANISDKALARNMKGFDKRHGSCDNGCDEYSRTHELSNRQATTVGAHGGECRKDVRAAIAKS
jgi:hypothetical protein